MRKKWRIISVLSVLFLSNLALAEEIKTDNEPEESVTQNWPMIRASDSDSKKYRGVATLDNDGYGCTAFLVCPSGCTNYKSKKAVVMTNGHCTKALDPNGVVRSTKLQKMEKHGDRSRVMRNVANKTIKFKFGDFIEAKDSEVVTATSEKILYASMKENDLAVIQLDKTYEGLGDVPCYQLADSAIPQDVTTVGRPFQDIPENERYHRQAQCKIEKKVGLIEGDWFWPKSVAMNCPARQGASGSPMFNDKGEVVGILNTGTQKPGPGSPRCPANSPCEIVGEGKTEFVKDKSYGFETGPLKSCFQKCEWNISANTCAVAKDSAPAFKADKTNMQKLKTTVDVPAPYTDVRYKFIPLGSDTCGSETGYKDPTKKYDKYVTLETPDKNKEAEGKYQLCVWGGIKGEDGTIKWDPTSKIYAKNMTIDRTPPEVKVKFFGNTVDPELVNPVDMGDASAYKKTVTDLKECNDKKGWMREGGAPWTLPKTGYVCITAADSAGNWQPVPLAFDSKGKPVAMPPASKFPSK